MPRDLEWLSNQISHMKILVEMGSELVTAEGEKTADAIADHGQVIFDLLGEELRSAGSRLRDEQKI